MSSMKSKLREVEDIVTQVELLLKKCFEEQDLARVLRSFHKGIHSLPMELLRYIFRMCIPDAGGILSVRTAPLLFGRVCQRWRNVAWADRQLWSRLRIGSEARLEETLDFYQGLAGPWSNNVMVIPSVCR